MNESPRPLQIAHVSGESGFSGGEVQVFLLLEGLRERGHRSVLVCPPGSRSEGEARQRGFDTRTVPMRNDLSPKAILGVRRALREIGPDLVHLHTGRANWVGGLAARSLALPSITTRRMDRPVRRGPRTRLLYRSLVRRVVAISPAVRRRLLEGGISERLTAVIPSAVDPDALRPANDRLKVREAEGLDAKAPLLLILAALVERKGIDVLLDALAILAARDEKPALWIAGEGPERAALEARMRAKGLEAQVRFLGRREDAGDLLAACDVAVLPSRHEGLGIAALEAMAAGRPLVASAVGGLGETVVHERTGLLVPPDDAPALAAALKRLLADSALRERLGAAGPGRVAEGFLAEQMVTAYESLYREVLAEVAG